MHLRFHGAVARLVEFPSPGWPGPSTCERLAVRRGTFDAVHHLSRVAECCIDIRGLFPPVSVGALWTRNSRVRYSAAFVCAAKECCLALFRRINSPSSQTPEQVCSVCALHRALCVSQYVLADAPRRVRVVIRRGVPHRVFSRWSTKKRGDVRQRRDSLDCLNQPQISETGRGWNPAISEALNHRGRAVLL